MRADKNIYQGFDHKIFKTQGTKQKEQRKFFIRKTKCHTGGFREQPKQHFSQAKTIHNMRLQTKRKDPQYKEAKLCGMSAVKETINISATWRKETTQRNTSPNQKHLITRQLLSQSQY